MIQGEIILETSLPVMKVTDIVLNDLGSPV